MNQYSLTRYLLIAVVLLGGALYALPNLYPADFALQISSLSASGARVDQGLRDQVADALQAAQVSTKGFEIDDQRLLVRLQDSDNQLLALEVTRTLLDEDEYVVAINLAPSTPRWLRALGAEPMVLGLDLQGGVNFLMEVDLESAASQALESYADDIRRTLRRLSDQGVRYRRVFVQDGGVVAQLSTEQSRQRVLDQIFRDIPDLQREEIDGGETFDVRFTVSEARQAEIGRTALQQNISTLRNRVNELGVAEPVVQQQGANRIIVQLPGVQDSAQAKRTIGRIATLEYRAVCMGYDAAQVAASGQVPANCRLYRHRDGSPQLLNRGLIVSGKQLTNAVQGFDPESGSPQVSVSLNGVGGQRMLEFTRDNVGNSMAVVFVEEKVTPTNVDGESTFVTRKFEEVISVATIQGVFGSQFRTTGLDSAQEASELALLLRAGALATPIRFETEGTIGPSLGRDNIDQGFNSVVIGFIAVLIFMAVYYRLFGLVADVALFANLILVVALLSLLGATLTLPGIAGIVLTVGMAVDANVLIFERVREELRNGNTPQASIRAGYDKAFSTIADANVTTLIAAIVLFSFGTGPIKGFAVTLSLGIVTSMFTSIMGTRAAINLIYGRRARIKSLAI